MHGQCKQLKRNVAGSDFPAILIQIEDRPRPGLTFVSPGMSVSVPVMHYTFSTVAL